MLFVSSACLYLPQLSENASRNCTNDKVDVLNISESDLDMKTLRRIIISALKSKKGVDLVNGEHFTDCFPLWRLADVLMLVCG